MSPWIGVAAALALTACESNNGARPAPREAGHSFFDDGRNFYFDALEKKTSPGACESRFAKMLEKGSVEVRIVFGYKDTRPSRFVGDLYERAALVEQLTRPCRDAAMVACGMERDPDDAEKFTKRLPRGRTVRLTVTGSAVGPDDQENRTSALQTWQSHHAEQTFLSGLQLSDVILYVGHSRDGGGPDFAPPLIGKSGHIDYRAYTDQRVTFKRTLAALDKRSRQHPLLLGLLSCSSSEHFAKDLKNRFPPLSLLSSRVLVYYSDALENALFSLNSFLRGDCDEAFRGALYTRSSRQPGIRLEGPSPSQKAMPAPQK